MPGRLSVVLEGIGLAGADLSGTRDGPGYEYEQTTNLLRFLGDLRVSINGVAGELVARCVHTGQTNAL